MMDVEEVAIIAKIVKMVEQQRSINVLWFETRTAQEAFLQDALRELHDCIQHATNAGLGGWNRFRSAE